MEKLQGSQFFLCLPAADLVHELLLAFFDRFMRHLLANNDCSYPPSKPDWDNLDMSCAGNILLPLERISTLNSKCFFGMRYAIY